MFGPKQATKGRETKGRSAFRTGADGNLQSEPEICVTVVVSTAKGAFAQSGDGVALLEDFFLLVGSLGRVQQFAFFHREQEEHSVDQPQQLLKILFRGECAGLQ